MAELTAQERSDPIVAEKVLGRLFEETSGPAKQRYLEFLSGALEYLSRHHPDRWGITLFSGLVRLNAGMVECLILHPGGLRVLLDSACAPVDTRFEEGTTYRSAPGCAIASLRFSAIPDVLTSLAVAHHSALSIAAKRKCTPAIRRSHSVRITKFLGQVFDRAIPNPTFHSALETALLAEFDEVADPQVFSEGERMRVLSTVSNEIRVRARHAFRPTALDAQFA